MAEVFFMIHQEKSVSKSRLIAERMDVKPAAEMGDNFIRVVVHKPVPVLLPNPLGSTIRVSRRAGEPLPTSRISGG